MKNDINPSFSKVAFLLTRGDTLVEDPKVVRSELLQNVATLRVSIGKLRAWQDLPAETAEGRDVFQTFSASVDDATQQLVRLIEGGDGTKATTVLERIADTCNNCHHFFRLKIEDSKVSRHDPAATPMTELTFVHPRGEP
jgi:hypothetical protein